MKKLALLLAAMPSLAHAATICKFKDDQGGNLKIEWKEVLPGGSSYVWNRYSYQLVQVSGELAGFTYDEPAVVEHRSISTRCGGESHSSFYLHNGYQLAFKEGDSLCGGFRKSATLVTPEPKFIPLECHSQMPERK